MKHFKESYFKNSNSTNKFFKFAEFYETVTPENVDKIWLEALRDLDLPTGTVIDNKFLSSLRKKAAKALSSDRAVLDWLATQTQYKHITEMPDELRIQVAENANSKVQKFNGYIDQLKQILELTKKDSLTVKRSKKTEIRHFEEGTKPFYEDATKKTQPEAPKPNAETPKPNPEAPKPQPEARAPKSPVNPNELSPLGQPVEEAASQGAKASEYAAEAAKGTGAASDVASGAAKAGTSSALELAAKAGGSSSDLVAAATAAGKAPLAAEAEVASALGKIVTKIPGLSFILKFAGILAFIPGIVGIVTDINKYGIEAVWNDTNLRIKLIENLIEIGGAAAFFIPGPPGWILGGTLTGLSYLIGKQREGLETTSTQDSNRDYNSARQWVEMTLRKNPDVDQSVIDKQLSTQYFFSKEHDLKAKTLYDKLVSEVPAIRQQMKAFKINNMQKGFMPNDLQKNTSMASSNHNNATAGNNLRIASNNTDDYNKVVISSIMNTIRNAEKLGEYKKADLMIEFVKSF